MTDTDRPDPTDADATPNSEDVEGRLGETLAADDVDVDVVGVTEIEIEDGQLAYECNAWAAESRDLLDSLLTTKNIPHAWQGTTVTVRDEDEDAVDDLVDEVLAAARPALDPEAPRVVYAVATWPVAVQTELVDALAIDDIPYEWDENGDLVVLESDEEVVSAVLDELPDPDEGSVSSDDGVALHELFDSVFMSSDKLAKHPTDSSATVTLVEASDLLGRVALPFGFEPAQWRALVGGVTALRNAIQPVDDTGTSAEQVDDARIAELAGDARDLIRQYI